MMASLAEVVLFYPLLPAIFMSLHRLPPAGFLWKVAGQLSSFARRRLRQKNKNVFQQLGGIVDAPLGAVLGWRRAPRPTYSEEEWRALHVQCPAKAQQVTIK